MNSYTLPMAIVDLCAVGIVVISLFGVYASVSDLLRDGDGSGFVQTPLGVRIILRSSS